MESFSSLSFFFSFDFLSSFLSFSFSPFLYRSFYFHSTYSSSVLLPAHILLFFSSPYSFLPSFFPSFSLSLSFFVPPFKSLKLARIDSFLSFSQVNHDEAEEHFLQFRSPTENLESMKKKKEREKKERKKERKK